MAVLKGMIESAGLSRATQQMVNYAFVTISAFRKYKLEAYTDKNLLKQGLADTESKNEWLDNCPEAQKYLKSYKDNMAEHRRLMLAVRRYDIYCYQIIGQYPEGGGLCIQQYADDHSNGLVGSLQRYTQQKCLKIAYTTNKRAYKLV